jgi:hypothetical protein
MTNLIERCVALFEDTLNEHYEIRVPAPDCLADMASTIIPVIQAEERARIVAWLRANRPSDAGAAGFTAYVINAFEAGEHLK